MRRRASRLCHPEPPRSGRGSERKGERGCELQTAVGAVVDRLARLHAATLDAPTQRRAAGRAPSSAASTRSGGRGSRLMHARSENRCTALQWVRSGGASAKERGFGTPFARRLRESGGRRARSGAGDSGGHRCWMPLTSRIENGRIAIGCPSLALVSVMNAAAWRRPTLMRSTTAPRSSRTS